MPEWVVSPASGGSSQLRDRIPSPVLQVDFLPSGTPEKLQRPQRAQIKTEQDLKQPEFEMHYPPHTEIHTL